MVVYEKVLKDCLASEQKYRPFITATVSHEMRNPLNSIRAQTAHQISLARRLAPSEQTEALRRSLDISHQATKLLDFNVENIVSLPKLKDKTFQKSFKLGSVEAATREVMDVVAWTAEQREISVRAEFQGL